MDYLLKLREAAKKCSKPEVRKALRAVADRLDLALTQFARMPTEANLITLNGAWASAARVARTVPPEGDPGTGGGSADPYAGSVVEEPIRKAA